MTTYCPPNHRNSLGHSNFSGLLRGRYVCQQKNDERKMMRKIMRKAMINPPSIFSRNGRLMRAGKMRRTLMGAED
jgi:hypothetical protein